jgi:pimeloyl-ACP methyl ester carboxylesterase
LFSVPPAVRAEAPPAVAGVAPVRFTVTLERHRMNVWQWGSGPAVMLVHGWGGQVNQMLPFVAPLLAAGYRVVAPELPGHGARGPRSVTLLDFVYALQKAGDFVGRADAVIAHSLGATAAALALSRGLWADRAVLFAPPAEVPYFVRRLAALLGLPPGRAGGVLRRVERRIGVPLENLDLRRVARKLLIPALFIHDPADRETPYGHSQAVTQAWPDACLLTTAGLGHRRVLEDPATLAAVLEFVGGGDCRQERASA